MFNTGIFPDELKIANVIPLFKKMIQHYLKIIYYPTINNCQSHRENYRHAVIVIFNENKPTFYNQFGFRPYKKEVPINIFLDQSKAFDTIDHAIVLTKLRYYGIHDTALLLIKRYLNNRKQDVEFEDTKSDIVPITVGVQQGSIPGPLLFIIYINDLCHASSVFKCIMYGRNGSWPKCAVLVGGGGAI